MDEEQDFFAYIIKNCCGTCQRQNRANPVTCEAFPEGIPTVIFLGYYDQAMPYNQDGLDDHGLRYLPLDGDAK